MKISSIGQQFFGDPAGNFGSQSDMGLGDKVARQSGTRLIHADGTFNVVRRGRSIFAPYQNLVEMGWWKFITLTIVVYLGCNMLFALGFFLLGSNQLNGVARGLPPWEDYLQCLYFSIQAFTTVGYGANALAVVTGLFFARFSRPYRRGVKSLQFRIATESPLRDWTREQFESRDSELLINNSYTAEQMDWDVRLQPMYQERSRTTELFLDRISTTSPAREEE